MASIQCTFVKTGKKMEEQPWYECLTCKVARVGICVSCKDVCHAGHTLSAVKGGKFYCDCGNGGFKAKNGLCKCLEPTTPVVVAVDTSVPVVKVVPQPTDAEITKITSSIKTGFVSPLESAIKRRDVSSMTNWKNQLAGKLTDFITNYSQFSETSPLIATFIKDIQAILANVQYYISQATLVKEIEVQSKDIINYAKYLSSAIDSKNITSVKHNYGLLVPKFQSFSDRFAGITEATPVIDTVNIALIKYQSEFQPILVEKEIEDQVKEVFTPMVGYLQTALKNQNVKSALNWLNNLNVKFPIFISKYSYHPNAQKIIELVNQVLLDADASLSTVIAEKEIEEGIKMITPILKALQGAMSRRDSKSAINWINQLTPRLEAFSTKYSSYPQSERFIQEASALLSNASAEFNQIIQEEGMNKSVNDIKPKVLALKGALERKDIKSVVNWKAQVTKRLATFELEYGANILAQTIIANTNDVLRQVDSELGQVIVEEEIEEQIKVMDPMVKALKGAFERKDIDSMIKWRNQVNNCLTPFTERFNSNAKAQAFINPTSAILTKISTDMGQVILEKEVNDRLTIFKPLISSLRGSFERKDVPAIINKKRQLENQHAEFIKVFPAAESNPVIKEMNALFASINESLGATIAEKEIQLQIATMSVGIKGLNGSLDRLDALSAMTWKNRLEPQLTLFENKYQSYPQSTQFIQEGKDLFAKVQDVLGAEMINQVNEQLAKLTLESSKFDMNSPVVVGETGTEVVDDGQVECVNKSNPKPKLKQELFMCITCSAENSSICKSCRDVCHAGHKIGPALSLNAKCDCESYERSNGPCQCDEFKQFPRQEYEPEEWVKVLGIVSDSEVKFLAYCFKYLGYIEDIFRDIKKNNDKERDLKRVSDLADGIYSIAKQIPVDLERGGLKLLMENVVKPALNGNNQKLIPEFWAEMLKEFETKVGGVKVLKQKDMESHNEKAMCARTVYIQGYRLSEWAFIQSTPKGREQYNKHNAIQASNLALIEKPIPWYRNKPTEQEKKQVDEFWNQYCAITSDEVPQLSKLAELETFLKEGESKLSGIRYFYEFKNAVSDYIGWLKFIQESNGVRPTHLPHSLSDFNCMFTWNGNADLVLYGCYHKEWKNFFHHLKEVTKKYSKAGKADKEINQELYDRQAFYYKDFYESATDCLKAYAFPLIVKWELKGKLEKTTELIQILEKHLGTDAEYLKLKEKYTDIRSRREKVYELLKAKDVEFNNILREASTQFQDSKVKPYLTKVSHKSYKDYDATREIIPSISSFKGKEIIFADFKTQDPVQAAFEEENGNWKLTWNNEVDGGDEFAESKQISKELAVTCHKKFDIEFDVSKNGSDNLTKYCQNRAKVARSIGSWTAAGTVKGLHNFTTTHYFTHPDANYFVLIPKDAVNVQVNKAISHYITTYTYIGHISIPNRTTFYTYDISYELKKVAVEIEVKTLKCDLFSSLEGSKTSLNGTHTKLRSIIPK